MVATNPRLKSILICVFALILLGCTQEKSPDTSLLDDRNVDLQVPDKKEKAHRIYGSGLAQANLEIEQLRQSIARVESEIEGAQSRLAKEQLENEQRRSRERTLRDSVAFVPTFGFVGTTLITVSFIFLVLNGTIWLTRQKMISHPLGDKWLYVLAILFIGILAAPWTFANDKPPRAEGVSKDLEDIQLKSLGRAHQLVMGSDVQRVIFALEDRQKNSIRNRITLPPLDFGEQRLLPLKSISGLGVEYHYTLAALYEINGERVKARDTLSKLINLDVPSYSSVDAGLIVNALVFLFEIEEHALVNSRLEFIIPAISDFSVLMILAKKLGSESYFGEAGSAYERALSLTREVSLLVDLAKAAFSSGLNENGEAALGRALLLSRRTRELTEIIAISSEKQLSGIVSDATERAVATTRMEADNFSVEFPMIYGLLIDQGEKGAAQNYVGGIFERANKTSKKLSIYMPVILRALVGQEQIESARFLLDEGLRETQQSGIEMPLLGVLEREKGLIDPNETVLSHTLYGTLLEAVSEDKHAEEQYVNAVEERLEQIVANYGFNADVNLNDFYLARMSVMQVANAQQLNEFDEMYKKLVEDRLERALQELKQTQRELDSTLEKRRQSLGESVFRLSSTDTETTSNEKIVLLILKNVVEMIVLLCAVLVGARLVYVYQARFSEFRFYAILSKSLETFGWMQILTVIGIPSGAASVFVGQGLLIFHRTSFSGESKESRDEQANS